MPSLVVWAGAIGATILGLTWVAYPAAVGLVSVFFPRLRTDRSFQPSISVILATRDPESVIRERVENLLDTLYPRDRMQVVVAVDASLSGPLPDLTGIEAWEGEAEILVVRGHEPGGKAQNLNAAAEVATGEILVFTDARQRFTPETIPELVAALAHPRIGGASGHLVLRRRTSGPSAVDLYWTLERWLRAREARIHSTVGVTGAVWALRASVWDTLPPGLILDDVYTPMRAVMKGHRIAHVRGAVAYETRAPTPLHEHIRKTRTLTGNLQLCAWMPEILMPWKNPLFLPFVLHKLFRLFTPFALLLILVSALWALGTSTPETGLPLVSALATLFLWLLVGWPPPARRLRGALQEVVLTQVAVVRATVNGLRGRWDVWDRSDGPE